MNDKSKTSQQKYQQISVFTEKESRVTEIKYQAVHISDDRRRMSLQSVAATSVLPALAALREQEIKFGIYSDIKFRVFSISPFRQAVICGVECYIYDNKLKVEDTL